MVPSPILHYPGGYGHILLSFLPAPRALHFNLLDSGSFSCTHNLFSCKKMKKEKKTKAKTKQKRKKNSKN
jgi:hypothetical protein